MVVITQYFIRKLRPAFYAFVTSILYSGRVKIGKNFRTDSVPRILVDKGCKIEIGDNVEFRRNIEIRAHNNSTIIIENDCRIDRGVRFLSTNESTIFIGKRTRVGLNTVFNGGANINVGEKCLISGFVYLQTSMHAFSLQYKAVQDQGYDHAPVILKNDCWLGTHAVIMPGIILEKGAVVGSNAVVTKNVSEYNIVGGIPAKIIKERMP